MPASPHLFAGVDRAVFVTTFAERLRAAGLSVPLGAVARTARSLEVAGPVSTTDLYWVLRISLLSRRDDIELFDRLFAAVFGFELNRSVRQRTDQQQIVDDGDALAPVRREQGGMEEMSGAGLPWTTRPAVVDSTDDEAPADEFTQLDDLLPSELSAIADTPFDLLDAAELEQMAAALELAATRWPRRPSRRRTHHRRRGRIELRTTLRRSLRTHGEPISFVFDRAQTRDRPLLLLVDVSGSMESFVRPYLHVTRTLVTAGKAEVFAFSTELTRITTSLKHRSPIEAIDRASEEVGDRFGGTRLASALSTLLAHRVWGSTLRGAVVVIISDGWDTDPPTAMTRAMARLSRRAHQVIWVNPRIAAPDFEPRVGSMAAALPFCDSFLAGNSATAMADVLRAITDGVAVPTGRREHGTHV